MGGELAHAWAFSAEEAKNVFSPSGSQQALPPIMYYLLLSKWNLLVYASQYPFAQNADFSLVEDPAFVTRDPDVAQNWGGDSAVWQYDTADPASVDAHKIAIETRTPKTTSMKPATQVLAIKTYIALLYTTLLAERQFTAAAQVLRILQALNSGQITDVEALDKVVALGLKT